MRERREREKEEKERKREREKESKSKSKRAIEQEASDEAPQLVRCIVCVQGGNSEPEQCQNVVFFVCNVCSCSNRAHLDKKERLL